MRLTVLGCDGSWAGPGGAGSGYLLQHDGFNVIFDLGGGTLGRLQNHLSVAEIDAIFISHIHPDHFADLYPLSIACHYGGHGSESLPLHAPPGFFERATAILVDGTTEAWAGAYEQREMSPRASLRIGPLAVEAFGMAHTSVALGYRVRAGEEVFAYTGDGGPSDEIVSLAAAADLLLTEATWLDGKELPFHLTARQAGEHAERAGVHKLVLTHIEPGIDKDTSLAQAAEAFSGDIVLAEQDLQLEIERV